ncbi:MAG: hypothetical protein M1838_005402 [Thelocarpon superellum]|nr:MAG: hypothetical protein M1838_005402 [Thelocarpon superellum]
MATPGSSTKLLDALSVTLVLRHVAPYLPLSARLSLAATSKTFRALILGTPGVFRYVDLSTLQSLKPFTLSDAQHDMLIEQTETWVSEDDVYSEALLGVFDRMKDMRILQDVQTLVLDGLSVPLKVVREIMTSEDFNVRILSLREVVHLDEIRFMQHLQFAVHPSRAVGTPKVKAIYFFGQREMASKQDAVQRDEPLPESSLYSPPATASSEDTSSMLSDPDHGHEWYEATGSMFHHPVSTLWGPLLQECTGIVAFDAVLCRSPRHHHPHRPVPLAIATLALGPHGCKSCGSSPESPGVLGTSPSHHLPLLGPPPLHSSHVRSAQRPPATEDGSPPPFYARCASCLQNRWCHRCHEWWCEKCYASVDPSQAMLVTNETYQALKAHMGESLGPPDVKVFSGLCVGNCLLPRLRSLPPSAQASGNLFPPFT